MRPPMQWLVVMCIFLYIDFLSIDLDVITENEAPETFTRLNYFLIDYFQIELNFFFCKAESSFSLCRVDHFVFVSSRSL